MPILAKSDSRIFLSLICFLVLAWQPAKAFDIHYVSVGNTWYRNTSAPLGDSNLGAKNVTRALRRAGAVDGITLISERGAYVTSTDVMTALADVIDKAQQTANPLIIFYFMGHGRSEGSTVDHVSITGSYQGANDVDAILAANDVRSALSSSSVPYILLMDNCFWREPSVFVASETVSAMKEVGLVGAAFVGQALKDATKAGTNAPTSPLLDIEIYASAEQEETATVSHPLDPRYDIGPLARRLLLLLAAANENQTSITLSSFISQMEDKSFDPVSVAGHVIKITRDDSVVLFQAEKPFEVDDIGELRRGSEE